MFSVVGVSLFVHRGKRWTSLYRDPTYTTAPPYGPGPSPTLYREILMLNPRHLQQNLYGLNPSVVLRMTLSPTNSSPSPQIKGSDVFCTVYGQLIHVLFNAFKALHFTPVTVEITDRQTDRQTDAPTQEESTLVVVELT